MAEPIVSDVVIAVLRASHEAVASHYKRVFQLCKTFKDEYQLSVMLERGYNSDLLDSIDQGKEVAFSHAEVTAIFRGNLRPALPRTRSGKRIERGIDRHIWGADYDRKTRSLFPTGRALKLQEEFGPSPEQPRTRISAVVQQALLRSRAVLQFEKAGSASRDPARDPARVFVPSPYYIARQILTDPEAPASEVYASAAIRVDLSHKLRERFGEIRLTYENVSRALDEIHSRTSTSKKAKAAGEQRGEAIFLRHYLAALGILSLQVEWEDMSGSAETLDLRVDEFLSNPAHMFDVFRQSQLSFRLDPEHVEFPDPGELLNELQGLPLPIEGAVGVFCGGLRFAAGGDIVASISGPSGAGKTTACLSLAASLAPLGCRTLFLSCEEGAEDIQDRLGEATPENIRRSTPLFNCVSLDDLRSSGARSKWFRAHKLRVGTDNVAGIMRERTAADVVGAVRKLIEKAIAEAPIFDVFNDQEAALKLPPFARRVIIIDGFHQLFRESSDSGASFERALRSLVDFCRGIRAVVVFTVAELEAPMQRLDYLCDLVVHLDRTGFDNTLERPTRFFKLLKARRQPAMIGSHILHLAGPKSLRIKPNMAARAYQAKSRRWMDPDPAMRIQLADTWDELRIQNRSHILIYGTGSSGKAGLGLYVLNRKALPAETDIPNIDLFNPRRNSKSGDERVRNFEARVLVVSFLYQPQYYRRLATSVRRSLNRRSKKHVADQLVLDVVSLYPGGLTPEDFVSKIENRLSSAELRGIPYTGVMIDGIHNVFVQFPALEEDATSWPQLYALLRRRGVTVITTHTEFELKGSGRGHQPTWVDFEHAQKKSAPLLSALVSAADYVFELSAEDFGSGWEYRVRNSAALGENPPSGFVEWDKISSRLGSWQASLSASRYRKDEKDSLEPGASDASRNRTPSS
jgi:hypothetical protein